ncbi:hypothetical protein EK21DRAFT_21140, partial [Setomelanomma holmii]
ILKRFQKKTSDEDESSKSDEEQGEETWRELSKLLHVAVKDLASIEAKKLGCSLHHLHVENELIKHENEGLK